MGLTTAGLMCTSLLNSSGKMSRRPNIVFILADDLGYGELGCYGQKKIRTPHIDQLSKDGMRFIQAYAGSPVCAPSRCSLLTGKHTGHAHIRGNDEMEERGDVWKNPAIEGQRPLLPGTQTLASLLKKAGYATGAIGKWGLGGPADSGHPNQQGFDFFYGYLCQRQAHNYYPTHLWRNKTKHVLEGNRYFHPHQRLPKDNDPLDPESYLGFSGKHYAPDLMVDESLKFIRRNRKNPFFLYLPFPTPHMAMQVPEDSLNEYKGKFPDSPYRGHRHYLPHRYPRAAYAAMITRMDREVGRIVSLLKELGLSENTLIVFTSDNGPTFDVGGVDTQFFNSTGPFRGYKASLYEGGIRVPLVVSWPGKIEKGAVSDQIFTFWDFMPTFADLCQFPTPADSDGISLMPTLIPQGKRQHQHPYLYWEHWGQQQAVRMGPWKGVRFHPSKPVELYNLEKDIGESRNVAPQHPKMVAKITEIFRTARTPSKYFPLVKKTPHGKISQ